MYSEDLYDSSSDEEISERLDKLQKKISTLSGINHEQVIKKSEKIFKLINYELSKKEKKINFLRDENYELQGQYYKKYIR
ncbi:10127_t:CDS:2 [Scutellospora calospora]|uniref:10127_t:CDS:1 n=1 Tax=Scutellospora calospora TaxID=85575 RepID=A0ACA9KEU2_9GLOM|nr:10127_t:CDS:2 [Scutellospora calospora]